MPRRRRAASAELRAYRAREVPREPGGGAARAARGCGGIADIIGRLEREEADYDRALGVQHEFAECRSAGERLAETFAPDKATVDELVLALVTMGVGRTVARQDLMVRCCASLAPDGHDTRPNSGVRTNYFLRETYELSIEGSDDSTQLRTGPGCWANLGWMANKASEAAAEAAAAAPSSAAADAHANCGAPGQTWRAAYSYMAQNVKELTLQADDVVTLRDDNPDDGGWVRRFRFLLCCDDAAMY